MVIFQVYGAIFTANGNDGVGGGDAPDGGVAGQSVDRLLGLAHIVGEVKSMLAGT